MWEYDGTVFLCISRSDRERRLTLCSISAAGATVPLPI